MQVLQEKKKMAMMLCGNAYAYALVYFIDRIEGERLILLKMAQSLSATPLSTAAVFWTPWP